MRLAPLFLVLALSNGGGIVSASVPPTCPEADADPGGTLTALAAEGREIRLAANPALRILEGERVTAMPRITGAAARAQAARARALLDRLACLDRDALDLQQRLTAAVLDHELGLEADFPPHHLLRFDLTPFRLGLVVSSVLPATLRTAPFQDAADVDAYLAFMEEIQRYLNDLADNHAAQVAAGIVMPRSTVPVARALVDALESQLPALVTVDPARLSALPAADRKRLADGLAEREAERMLPAIRSLRDRLGADYAAQAPDGLGLALYPDGTAYYRYLVRRETTLDMDPDAIHRAGLERVAELGQRMAALRERLGFDDGAQAFHAALRDDPRFIDPDPQALEARYRRYLDPMVARLDEQFSLQPRADWGLQRLDPAAEAGVTFGYYQPPARPGGTGYFRFNGSDLENRPAVWAGALIYHELIPGHHFQIALAQENTSLSPYRKGLFVGAFTEGWANYASRLGVEMGLLDDPWDRYGWLLYEAFAAARLVVDTGLNHRGWTPEQAADYLREHTFATDREIATELPRYGMALPAQALTYHLGYTHILDLRNRVRAASGPDWDPRRFHAVVLGAGALPLPVLTRHVEATFGLE